jgi:hypothetical protein
MRCATVRPASRRKPSISARYSMKYSSSIACPNASFDSKKW